MLARLPDADHVLHRMAGVGDDGEVDATFLFTLDRSISIWTLRLFGLNASRRPVTRSSKRLPIAMTRSAWFIAMFASNVPCMPSMPRNCCDEAGKAPRPISVEVTGAPEMRASSISSCDAAGPELMTPPPV